MPQSGHILTGLTFYDTHRSHRVQGQIKVWPGFGDCHLPSNDQKSVPLTSARSHHRQLHIDLGNDEPLYIKSIRQGPPDRRRVSLRWLGGSVLTAVFSILLVGGALEAAIGHGETGIVRPALAVASTGYITASVDGESKGDRIRPVPQSETCRRVIQVSTVTRMDDRDLIKVRPFAHVRTGLALPVAPEIADAVPPFNPLAIFADGGEPEIGQFG